MEHKNVTRAELAQHLARLTTLTKSDSLKITSCLFDEIACSLKKGNEVKIPIFGVFYTRKKRKRMGRNPKTLEQHVISSRTVVGFRVSRLMKDRVNLYLSKLNP